jgi:beta-lactamase class A
MGVLLAVALSACASRQPAPPAAAPTPTSDLATLEQRLRALIAREPGAEVAVAVDALGTGQRLSINGDLVMHAASTMKVPVLVEYVRRQDRGEIPPDATIRLVNRFASAVDGSPYTLDPGDDSDSTVYREIGRDVRLDWLAERMITHSSNLATNVLIDRLTPAAITGTARALGMTRTEIRRGVEDNVAFRAGIINETTADDLATLMAAIVRGTAASPAGSQRIVSILSKQAFNDGIPAGLPADVRVAHKTGEITATHHDAAIVYPPAPRAPYVLVVLTRAIPDRARAVALTQQIAREVHATRRP